MSLDSILSTMGVAAILALASFLLWYRNRYFSRSTTVDLLSQPIPMISPTSWAEKRQHPRVAVSWDASLETPRGTMDGKLRDVSYGGAFVRVQEPLPMKEALRITIKIPNNPPLLPQIPLLPLNAEVVWSNANVPEHLIINRGMALRFINNSEESLQRLRAAIGNLFNTNEK